MVKKTEEEAKASMAATSFQSHSKTSGGLHYDESSVAAGQHSLENVQSKDHLSSESEFSPKVRKPYTITKQRERWKEEEHEKFLEALKLYGRDWRQIEEHVGTKTAVQIRSHAQKFFSKVTRNSNGCSTTLVECIEIPPPRPKRKPLHPYPRKEAHHLHKVPSIQEQTRSLSPQLSVTEQECQSPTSIVAAASRSDTLISAKSSILYDSESPDSSIPFVSGGLACTEPNSSSLENESPTPNLETENSMPHEKYSKNFELFPEEDADEKDVLTQEVSMQSLKLFGRTVLVTNPHKPIPTLEICAEEPTNKHVGNYKQTSPWNSMVTESSMENIECTKSHGAFYFIQLNNGNSNHGDGSAVPVSWWSSCGGFPFTFVHYSKQDTAKEESDLNSEVDDKESHKDQSWCGSNTGLVNGGEIDDKYVEIDIQSCLENKSFVSVSKHKLIGKPLYSEVRIRNGKNRKGFVPYKRCIAEKRNNQSTITGADGEEKRIRLCL